MFLEQCKCVYRLISDSRMKFYANTINDNSNPRVLFSTFLNCCISRQHQNYHRMKTSLISRTPLPSFLRTRYSQSLRENMLEVTDSPQVSTCHSPTELLEFSPNNIIELSSLLRTTAGKSCMYLGSSTWCSAEGLL